MDNGKLKSVVAALNALDIEGVEKVKVIGIKKDLMVELFLSAVEFAADNGHEDQLTAEISEAYNEIVTEQKAEASGEGGAKKESGKKAPAAKKEPKPQSRYGHLASALSGKLDDMLFEGATVQKMMDTLDVKRTRVMGHAKHLRNDLGLTVNETKPEGEGFKLNDTHIKVVEEKYVKQ